MPEQHLIIDKRLILMILKQILDHIKYFVTQTHSDKKYNEKMHKILQKLKDKAQKLEVELENEKNEKKCKNINQMLKVIYKQQQKGEKLIQEKERSSHSSRYVNHRIKPKLSPPIV